MKKNVASQVIGAQMVAAADGSAFTGAVTVHVTGDGGTQAQGSVGSGACTHEGNGFHTYVPAQAETNYDHIGFTFVGAGAVPATVQLYTEFPQTGDNFARLGAPAGASVSADVAAVKAVLPAALVSGRIDASVGAMAANVMTAAAAAADLTTELQAGLATQVSVDDLPTNAELATALGTADDAVLVQISLVKAKTDNLPTDPADESLIIAATDALATLIGDVPTNAELATALGTADDAVLTQVALVKAKTDLIPAAPAAVGDVPTAIENADALLNRNMATGTDSGSPTVRTVRQAIRVLRNRVEIATGTMTVFKEDDTTASFTAAVTGTPGADPITEIDPAGP